MLTDTAPAPAPLVVGACGCQLIDVEERHFCAELDALYDRYIWARRHRPDYETERAAFEAHFFGAVVANRWAAAAAWNVTTGTETEKARDSTT